MPALMSELENWPPPSGSRGLTVSMREYQLATLAQHDQEQPPGGMHAHWGPRRPRGLPPSTSMASSRRTRPPWPNKRVNRSCLHPRPRPQLVVFIILFFVVFVLVFVIRVFVLIEQKVKGWQEEPSGDLYYRPF